MVNVTLKCLFRKQGVSLRRGSRMIFVSGLSKSGKTYTVKLAGLRDHRLVHVKASAILKASNRPLTSLTSEDVLENQRVLISALKDFRAPPGCLGILDGHTIVETDTGTMVLPDWVFDELGILAFVLVADDLSSIVHRRAGTGLAIDLPEICARQELERRQAEHQARRLGVTFVEIKSGDVLALLSAAKRVLVRPELPRPDTR